MFGMFFPDTVYFIYSNACLRIDTLFEVFLCVYFMCQPGIVMQKF